MWPKAGIPDGSFYFENQPNVLDQFLINTNMATEAARLRPNPSTAQILKPPKMVDSGVLREADPVRRHGKPSQPGRLL